METFWKLYLSENPEIDIKSLYGLDRKEAVQRYTRSEIINEGKTLRFRCELGGRGDDNEITRSY
jgi:hypothetical protein